MAIFTKTKAATTVRQVSAATLATEIDNLTKSFTTLSKKLQAKAKEANALREAKEAEIAALQVECSGLTTVSDRALNISTKIDSLMN
jgi:hypothetical protein